MYSTTIRNSLISGLLDLLQSSDEDPMDESNAASLEARDVADCGSSIDDWTDVH